MMRILALETSGTTGSVAVLEADNLLCETPLDPSLRSARSLAPAIRELLSQVGWMPKQVQLVAVTAGPGSFTGLRVGLTTAKAFAYAAGAEVLGVDTLEVLAEQAPAEAQVIKPILDAQRQELFAATYINPLSRRVQAAAAHIVPIDAWLASLSPGEMVIGPVLGKLSSQLPDGISIASESTWTPMAASVGRIAHRRYESGQRDDVFQLAPLYLRRSAAEEKADAAPPGGGG